MSNKNYDLDSQDKSSWLDSNLLLSLTLFLSTYTVFGWAIASQALLWTKLLALVVIILLTFLLSAPVALTTFLFQDSIHSDLKGFLSILLWSVVLVFAFCSFDYFADFLVIISANLLLRLDLQKLKYRNWQIIVIILFCASMAFAGGMILFNLLSQH